VRHVGSLQRVLVVEPDARLTLVFNGPLSGVLVCDTELLLGLFSTVSIFSFLKGGKVYLGMVARV